MKFASLNLVNPDQTGIPKVVTDPTKSNYSLPKVLTLFFIMIGALSILMLVIAGFRYVVSGGNKDKMATAKSMIIYTVIGVIVSASAITFVNVVAGRI